MSVKFVSSASACTTGALARLTMFRRTAAGSDWSCDVHWRATRANGIWAHCQGARHHVSQRSSLTCLHMLQHNRAQQRRVGDGGKRWGTHAFGQADDGVLRAAFQEMVAARVVVHAHEADVLIHAVGVARQDLPPRRGRNIRNCAGRAPLCRHRSANGETSANETIRSVWEMSNRGEGRERQRGRTIFSVAALFPSGDDTS